SFNGDLSGWVTSNVTNMRAMFQSAPNFNQSIGNWDITQVERMDGMLIEAGLSVSNYDATLTGWAAQSGLQRNVLLDAHELYFCAGENARQKLVDDFGWAINDAGKSSGCGTLSITPGDPGNFVTTWLVDADDT